MQNTNKYPNEMHFMLLQSGMISIYKNRKIIINSAGVIEKVNYYYRENPWLDAQDALSSAAMK